MRAAAAMLVSALVLGLAACGGAEQPAGQTSAPAATTAPTETEQPRKPDTGGSIPEALRASLTEQCVQDGSASPETCDCLIGEIEASKSFGQYIEYGEALSRGETPELPRAMREAGTKCAAAR